MPDSFAHQLHPTSHPYPGTSPNESENYINIAVVDCHLQEEDKAQLRHLLESNPQVCSHRPGKMDVLQHTTYTANCVPIKQRPCRVLAAK